MPNYKVLVEVKTYHRLHLLAASPEDARLCAIDQVSVPQIPGMFNDPEITAFYTEVEEDESAQNCAVCGCPNAHPGEHHHNECPHYERADGGEHDI